MGSFYSEGTNPRYKMNKFWESNVQHGDCRYQSCIIGLLATEMGSSLGRQWGVLLWNSDTCNLKISMLFHAVMQRHLVRRVKK